jgi:hypothetical protein
MKFKEVQILAGDTPADGNVTLPAATVMKLVGIVEGAIDLVSLIAAKPASADNIPLNFVPLALKIGALEP